MSRRGETYFLLQVNGVTHIARISIRHPGKTWIHRDCLWQLLP